MRSIRLVTGVVLSAIFIVFGGYRDGDFTISQYRKAAHTPIQKTNDIIRNGTGDTLLMLDSIPQLRPGQLIMRKKISNEYTMHFGTLDTSAFSKRPVLYAFPIPGWAQVNDIALYRFYREPTEKIGSDEETVFFDNERIYIRNFSILYYFRNGIWFKLEGTDSLLTGGLTLQSDPSGAQVILNGENTHLLTPCKINKLLPGIHKLELFLDSYHFFQKSIKVFPDSTVAASFQLLSDMDTVYITGNASYGLLLLPQPPLDSLFSIDSNYIDGLHMRLPAGTHRLRWNGGIFYESIDTEVTVTNGVVNYFDFVFKRRFGILRIVPVPVDAEVCIDNNPCRFGEQIMEIPSGAYRITAHRYGFKSLRKEIMVFPDTIISCEMNLLRFPDSDADGFIDSIDQCPHRYGLHDGCPRQRLEDVISIKKDEVTEFIKNDPLSIDVSTIGFIVRMPAKSRFADFLSSFSSGKIGGVNNYRGLTFLNSYQVSLKGFFAAAELGQWSSGIRFQRKDTMSLMSRDSVHYKIFFDSLAGVEPIMIIPSTSFSLGVHYNLSWVNVAYSLGYQWEDILVEDIYNTVTGTFESVKFDNDWWYHQLQFEGNFRVGESVSPVAYFKFRFPFGKSLRTRWHVMEAGVQLKFTPLKRTRR